VVRHEQRQEPKIDWSPVAAAGELEIDAPIERVWGVLTAIERWPTFREPGVPGAFVRRWDDRIRRD